MVEWKECERLGLSRKRGKTVKIMTPLPLVMGITPDSHHSRHTRPISCVARGLKLPWGKFPAFLQLNRRQKDSTLCFYHILG